MTLPDLLVLHTLRCIGFAGLVSVGNEVDLPMLHTRCVLCLGFDSERVIRVEAYARTTYPSACADQRHPEEHCEPNCDPQISLPRATQCA